MAFDLPTDVAYADGTNIVGDVLNLLQLELEVSLDPIATARSSVNLAARTSNSNAQGNSDNADGGSTAADEAEAVDQQPEWQRVGSIAGQVSVWGHAVVPAPAVVRTARPCPPLADGQHFAGYACGFKYAGALNRAPVGSGRSRISKHNAVAARWDAAISLAPAPLLCFSFPRFEG
jgi:hypothetical protein